MTSLSTPDCNCGTLEANKHLLSVEQAQVQATEIVPDPVRQELVSLTSSLGRVAARDLHAPTQMALFR